jgi:hypothetical protein
MARMTAEWAVREGRHGCAQSKGAQADLKAGLVNYPENRESPETQFERARCLARQAGPGPRI